MLNACVRACVPLGFGFGFARLVCAKFFWRVIELQQPQQLHVKLRRRV